MVSLAEPRLLTGRRGSARLCTRPVWGRYRACICIIITVLKTYIFLLFADLIMSSNTLDSLAIEFRAFLVTFTDLLTAEEVYKVAFILLKDKVDVSIYAPSSTPQICALELFWRLECYGVFSWKNIGGLIDIAKKIKRKDLVNKVKEFTKNKGEKYGTRYTKKGSSEERQRLEKTLESMVTEMTVLEQHISMLQKTLQESDDANIVDEGLVIVESSACIAKRLVLELSQVQEKLVVSRSRSGSSGSSTSVTSGSSNDSSRRNSREVSEAVYPLPETSQYTSINTCICITACNM